MRDTLFILASRDPLSVRSCFPILDGLGGPGLLLLALGFSPSGFVGRPFFDWLDEFLDGLERLLFDEETELEDRCRLCLGLVEDDATELLEGEDPNRRDSSSQVWIACTLDALDNSISDSQSSTGC